MREELRDPYIRPRLEKKTKGLENKNTKTKKKKKKKKQRKKKRL